MTNDRDTPPERPARASSRTAGGPARRLPSSVRWKLAALIFGVAVLTIGALAAVLPRRQLESARRRISGQTTAYARVLSRELEPAIAFDDRETAREVFEALALDEDVRAMALFDDRGRPLQVFGEPSEDRPPSVPTAPFVVAIPGGLRAVAPVISKEGPRGVVVIEVSAAALDRERADVLATTLLVSGVALACGLLAAWWIGGSIAARLRALAAVTEAIAGGELSESVPADRSFDEVGQLSRSVDAMLKKILELMGRIEGNAAHEKQRLETLVNERTRQLDERNRDMRLVLDHVAEGFLTLDLAGTMRAERSAILGTWFGTDPGNEKFSALLERVERGAGVMFSLAWKAVVDGYLPVELTLDQLPRSLRDAIRSYELEYSPIFEGSTFRGALVVVRDVTATIARAESEAAASDILGASQHLVADRGGFREFVRNAEGLVSRVTSDDAPSDPAALRRDLHTLKGNCGMFGLVSLAGVCHTIEGGMAERRGGPSALERGWLRSRWRNACDALASLLGSATSELIELTRDEIETIARSILQGNPRPVIARALLSLVDEPVDVRLKRLADYARALAERLGKGGLRVECASDGTRLDAGAWKDFWACLMHVARNAVDHGIEAVDERRAAGKSAAGALWLQATSTRDEFVITIRDDGRGIDWDALRESARIAGLASSSRGDLEEALFADGITTRAEATEVSGRGVGLGAARAACRDLGGRVVVDTFAGGGTCFAFHFPLSTQLSGPERSARPSKRASIQA